MQTENTTVVFGVLSQNDGRFSKKKIFKNDRRFGTKCIKTTVVFSFLCEKMLEGWDFEELVGGEEWYLGRKSNFKGASTDHL